MIKIWDKLEPINGKIASEVLANREDLRNEKDVLLIVNSSGHVDQIQLTSFLRGYLNLDNSLTPLEVGEAYLKNIEEVNKQSSVEQQEKQSQEDRIKALENTILELKEVI